MYESVRVNKRIQRRKRDVASKIISFLVPFSVFAIIIVFQMLQQIPKKKKMLKIKTQLD